MKLSELYELSPLGWEEAKRETIRFGGLKFWNECERNNYNIGLCFDFYETKMTEMWSKLYWDADTTLLKEWEAKQIK